MVRDETSSWLKGQYLGVFILSFKYRSCAKWQLVPHTSCLGLKYSRVPLPITTGMTSFPADLLGMELFTLLIDLESYASYHLKKCTSCCSNLLLVGFSLLCASFRLPLLKLGNLCTPFNIRFTMTLFLQSMQFCWFSGSIHYTILLYYLH